MKNQIVANMIRTPDGTVLQSFHRHDYKTYTDKNGKEYMVDGGLDYTRRFVHDDAPYEELSVNLADGHDKVRQAFCWGTRGIDGKQRLTWLPLCNMTTDHIKAILDTQTIKPWMTGVFQTELDYRWYTTSMTEVFQTELDYRK